MAMMDKREEVRLINRSKRGDSVAIEALIRNHQQALYAFMLRMSGRPETAEDIVQEAFVRVLGNIERFDTRFRFSTWVFTIARRLYVNAMQKKRPVYDTDSLAFRSSGMATPGGISATGETKANINHILNFALMDLNDQQREIILLFHQQDWSIANIADHLDMPQGTVKSHLHRARKRMRRTITENETLLQRTEEVWA